jgi:sugar phosphate isomerase/epimerase
LIRLGLHHLTVADVSAVQLIEIAATIGVRQVSVFVEAPRRNLDLFPTIRDQATASAVAEQLAARGVIVHNLEAYPLKRGHDLRPFRRSLEIGAFLGAARVTAQLYDSEESEAADTLASFCALVAEYGLPVGVEFMPFAKVDTLDKAVRVVSSSGATNASVTVDILHLTRTGSVPADLKRLDPKLIGYAQICDAPARINEVDPFYEAISERMIPGDGELPLREFVASLPDDLTLDIEVPLAALQANGVGPLERARRVSLATRKVLEEAGKTEIN